MFENIGGKIKTLAKVLTIIGIVASVLYAITSMVTMVNNAVLYGMLIIISGSLLSWISSFVLYGFGSIVENIETLTNLQLAAKHHNTEYRN